MFYKDIWQIQMSINTAGGTGLLLLLVFIWSFELQHFVQSCMHVLYAEQNEGIKHCKWETEAVSEHIKHVGSVSEYPK